MYEETLLMFFFFVMIIACRIRIPGLVPFGEESDDDLLTPAGETVINITPEWRARWEAGCFGESGSLPRESLIHYKFLVRKIKEEQC
jgi:hypothetical protein